MKVRNVLEWLDALAPLETAEGFDNVGLLMGDADAAVERVLFCMDVTCDVAAQAVQTGAQLIVSHHPFIFSALKRIDYSGPQGRTLQTLAAAGVSVLAGHTNWDKAPGGVSDSLAEVLGLMEVRSGDDYLRVGRLPSPLTREAFRARVEKALHAMAPLYGPAHSIVRVAVAGGAYGEGAALAHALGADAFVVGEARHHELVDACQRGLTVCVAGHYATELPGVAALCKRFEADARAAGWPVQARLHTSPPYEGALLAP